MNRKIKSFYSLLMEVFMEINVCVGSSCHLKGSYDILKKIEALVKFNQIENSTTIKASFCLGNCTRGVSMEIDGELIQDATINNIDDIFYERLKRQ